MTPQVLRLDHVQVAMPPGAEDAARAFYAGLLGLQEIPKPGASAARGGAWFRRGEVEIHLGVEADFRPARKAHPALVVQGYDTLLQRLRAAGYTPQADDSLAGVVRCFVADPFGNRIELICGDDPPARPTALLGQLQIRPLAPGDTEAARQLLLAEGWVRCVADAHEFHTLLARSQLKLVAERDGQVLGFLRAITDGMANAYLSMLVVHEQHRGQGIGRALVQAAMGDNPRMTWVLRAARTPGVQHFYEKLGFAVSEVAMERPGLKT